jgi:hypothetical protein
MADVFVLEPWIIWAFCFSTSAGVSIRHDTISPVEEAIPCIIGVGRACVKGRRRLFREPSGKVLFPPVMLVGASAEELYIMLFTVSYVVKNAPEAGIVEKTTLQTPWYNPRKSRLRRTAPVRASLKTFS